MAELGHPHQKDADSLVPITVAYGDGIGPEIMSAVLSILEAAGARIKPEIIEIGEKVYLTGATSGITDGAWESLRRTKVFLKAPITTPQGGGYKSLNVTVRKTLGLFANVRPVQAFSPYVKTNFPTMDLVIVRENEEDLYAGIEHRQTQDVYQCLKLISRPGCERIVRYAFEYAIANGRKKVSCFSKDNIMKMSDGILHSVFDEIAKEYPQIETDHYIIDIGSARLANDPKRFDVIVTSNLYGDIISDIAAEVSGSVGLGASFNLGTNCAMFEAIHGSAPDIAGKDLANPSGLLLAAINMLVHIGQADVAARVKNAWACALEDGYHTADIYQPGVSKEKVGTAAFAKAINERMGCTPKILPAAQFSTEGRMPTLRLQGAKSQEKVLTGVDVFACASTEGADYGAQVASEIAKKINEVDSGDLRLKMITNRGVKVWPEGYPETFCVDHWRCRFHARGADGQLKPASYSDVLKLLEGLVAKGIEVIKTENLYLFDGKPGFSMGQGE